MANGFKNMLRRLGRPTRLGPVEPPMMTHETMLIEHLRRQDEERLRRGNWERRFPH
ncbi:hypothetical protein [uncultured Jannaschia sp.]|uniref:hypothetical protein n=1 Tax=uncultured Jannaschia sp. TaxID=293347 RepID=UPI00262C667C|nr:hypothetical protein [uncultured Jannaschia sp.]